VCVDAKAFKAKYEECQAENEKILEASKSPKKA
jgi:hypothetical protein